MVLAVWLCALTSCAESLAGAEPTLDLVTVEPAVTSPLTLRPRFRLVFDGPVAPRGVPLGEVYIESGEERFSLDVEHDPSSNAVSLVPRVILDPDAAYRLEIGVVRGLGGGTTEPMTVRFATGDIEEDTPASPTWADVAPLLAHCARCHVGPDAPLGLDLSTPDAVRATAIGVPAVEVRTADRAVGGSLEGLMRIEPGAPELSFLIWKLTGDVLVPGDPMPADEPLPPGGPSLLARWVAAGAPL